jgi:hypothetical protein
MGNKILVILLIIVCCVAAYVYSNGDIHFGGIKPKELTMEYGGVLPKAKEYYVKSDVDTTLKYYQNGEEVKEPVEVGEYDVEVILNPRRKVQTKLKIQDTSAPTFKLIQLVIKKGTTYTPDMFVLEGSAFDLSGEIEFQYTDDKFGYYSEIGIYNNIGIKAIDKYNNALIQYTTLIIQ